MNNLVEWFRKFWKVFLGLAVMIGALTAGFQLRRDIVEIRATPTPSPTNQPTGTPLPSPTASFTPTFTPGPFQFIELPVQVKAGEDMRVVVQAWQGAACHLDYFTPDDNLSTSAGLGSTLPDSRSQCVWEWHIRADTTTGIGKLVVQINDLMETHEFEILPPK